MKIIGEHFTFVKVVPLMFYVEPCSSKSWRIGELPPEIRNYAYRIIPLQNSQNIHVGVARLNLKPLPFSFSLVLKKEAPVDTSREGVVKLEQQLGDFGFYASLLPEETINSLRELGFHYVSIMTSGNCICQLFVIT